MEKKSKWKTEILGDGALSKLPMDVCFDILSRLPLKTISQCRWVCKTWYELVLHPRFAKIHYATTLHNSSPPCIVVSDSYKYLHLIDHQVFNDLDTTTNVYKLRLRQGNLLCRMGPVICYDVLGSVNGLVCFRSSSPFNVWNPITGEYITLPKSPRKELIPLASGFGFDSNNDHYKVVQIFEDSSKVEAEVFTLGSGNWRAIQNVPNITPTLPYNVFVNDNLHWLSREAASIKVVSFNVRTEEFNVFELPTCFKKGVSDRVKGLGVLGEHLCLVDDESAIWVMKDYGVPESWSKEYQLEKVDALWKGGHKIIELNNGEFVLLDWKKRISYYNPLTNIYKPITLNNLPSAGFRQPIIQVGSLFSPKNLGDQ